MLDTSSPMALGSDRISKLTGDFNVTSGVGGTGSKHPSVNAPESETSKSKKENLQLPAVLVPQT